MTEPVPDGKIIEHLSSDNGLTRCLLSSGARHRPEHSPIRLYFPPQADIVRIVCATSTVKPRRTYCLKPGTTTEFVYADGQWKRVIASVSSLGSIDSIPLQHASPQ